MAAPKFPLTMGDGFEARTLEELREHADLYTLEQHYLSGALHRWLKVWGHSLTELDNIISSYDVQNIGLEEIDTFHQVLCKVLDIPWNPQLEEDYLNEVADRTIAFESEDKDMNQADSTATKSIEEKDLSKMSTDELEKYIAANKDAAFSFPLALLLNAKRMQEWRTQQQDEEHTQEEEKRSDFNE